MPIYDTNAPYSDEAKTLEGLEDWLTYSVGAQALVEVAEGDADEVKRAKVLEKIIVGPHEGPWDGDRFNADEIAARFVEIQIMAPTEAGKIIVVEGFETSTDAQFLMITRRHCRPNELQDRRDLYLGFLDRVARMESDLAAWFGTRECPRIKRIERLQLGFSSVKSKKGSGGEYMVATHAIPWGDPVEQ